MRLRPSTSTLQHRFADYAGILLMCRLFLVVATVFPMLVHSILGCCWHHAHVAASGHDLNRPGTEDAHDAGRFKSCCHGHSHNKATAASTDVKGLSRETRAANGSSCPAHDSAPCDEEHCTEYWAETAQAKISFAAWIVQLTTGQTPDCFHRMSTISIGSPVPQYPRAIASRPHARAQVWLI